MLSREDLLRLARARRVRPWQEEKRYIQSLVIYAISEWPVVMKGGTYLWLFHGLNRFSDDLDFTQLETIRRDVLEDLKLTLELFGAKSDVKVLKDDDHTLTFRVSVKGPLYSSEKDICHVRLDISRRERVILPPIPVKLDEPHYGIPITYVKGMDLREVLAEKLRAFIVRANVRDLYDIWFLLRKGVTLDWDLLEEKMSFYGMEITYPLKNLRGIGERWRSELRAYIFGELPPFEEVVETVENALENLKRSISGRRTKA